ncbi:MAG TPA: hypothetical protein VJW76_02990 [Verrucomicrobiae bacterium]|nr:hypothetical protein [Verrucomicrobiae bacterium]
MADETIVIEYKFSLKNGDEKRFQVRLRKPTLQLISAPNASLPEWTRLVHHQCPNCPLKPETDPHCPIAANLVDVIDSFKNTISVEEADITITHESRSYRKHTAVQYGISSLMGIYMVTSGCPVMDKLRPMAHTHLPFATIAETMFRAVSMYLLAQYFRQQHARTPDWRLEKLVEIYEQVGKVNRAFSKRLLSINPQDASLNALVGLDCFATITAYSIVDDSLEVMESLFQAYLTDDD